MIDRDELGRAIHAAKRVGGPWGPCCWRPREDLGREPREKEDGYCVDYDDNSMGDYACECSSMAAHLIEIMRDPLSNKIDADSVFWMPDGWNDT